MRKIKPVSYFLILHFFLLQSFGNMTLKTATNLITPNSPPDSSVIYHNRVSIFCGDYNFIGVRSTLLKKDTSSLHLSVKGQSKTGIDLFPLECKSGQLYTLQFSNSSVIYLNSTSTLLFNPQAANHFELKKGEAFFDINQVARIQITEKMGIWALAGTEIHIKHYDDYPFEVIEVSCLKGSSKIDIDKVPQELQPGQTVRYSNNGELLSKADINQNEMKTWMEETFNYLKIAYSDLVVRFGRWYGLQVDFVGEPPGKLVGFNGNFYEPLDAILERLNSKVRKYKCRSEGGKLIVER